MRWRTAVPGPVPGPLHHGPSGPARRRTPATGRRPPRPGRQPQLGQAFQECGPGSGFPYGEQRSRWSRRTGGGPGTRARRPTHDPASARRRPGRAGAGPRRARRAAPAPLARPGNHRAAHRLPGRRPAGARCAAAAEAHPPRPGSGRSSWCRAAKLSSISLSTPPTRATWKSGGRWPPDSSAARSCRPPAHRAARASRSAPGGPRARSRSSRSHSTARPTSPSTAPIYCRTISVGRGVGPGARGRGT